MECPPPDPLAPYAPGIDGCCPVIYLDENGTPVEAGVNNPLPVDATLVVSDIEIGAVEIKDGTANTRATVLPGNTAGVGDNALVVADANVLAELVAVLAALNGGGAAGTPVQSPDQVVTSPEASILAANAARVSALIQNVGSANIRVTVDGSAATATHGHQLLPGQVLSISGPKPSRTAIHAIREGATDSAVSVSQVT